MLKVLVLSVTNLDFTNRDGDTVKGTSLKYLDRIINYNGNVEYKVDKLWFRPDSDLLSYVKTLLPGQFVELDFSVEGRNRVVLSGIYPGDLAVDFDNIFTKGEF